jgi:hypothetical protein
MAFDSKGLDDYIDVAQRIAEFRVKHPEGSLQPLNPEHPFEIRELAGTGKDGKEVRGTFIIYTAAAYRSTDDARPWVGCAYEVFPGRTPYTAGSELQNAETAAWGRAIVAALAADTRAGIASQQEVRNRQAEGRSAGDVFDSATPAPPRQSGNGQQRGQASGPPQSEPAAANSKAIDADAQKFADEADKATTPREMEDIHRRAREAGKLARDVRSPASGGVGKLAVYLDWRRKQVNAACQLPPEDPWAPKVDALANAEDATAVLDELARMLLAGEIADERATQVENAVIVRFPDAGREAGVAA